MQNRSMTAIDRVSPNDLMSLVTDGGSVPVNMAAILQLAPGADHDLAAVHSLLAGRITAIPRLRQRLVAAPFGCGRPHWVDDAQFDLSRHVTQTRLGPHEDDDGELLTLAAALVCTRLDRDRPLWRARLVTGLSDDSSALILVVHHVLADGLGGLAVLAALCDGFPTAEPRPFPQPAPTTADLVRHATRERLAVLRSIPARVARTARGIRELSIGGSIRPRLVSRSSILQPTGPTRRLTLVTTSLTEVKAAAREHGATVNDTVVAAITGALVRVLAERGEHPGELVVSMPISTRRSADHSRLGNEVGVAPVRVPATDRFGERLRAIRVQAGTARGGDRGSSAGVLAAVWRTLGTVGLVQHFVNHQRLVHTFVTNLHGPDARLRFARHEITRVIPIVVNPGNVAVTFGVLSYAGELVFTVVADPEIIGDQSELTALLADQLAQLAVQPAG